MGGGGGKQNRSLSRGQAFTSLSWGAWGRDIVVLNLGGGGGGGGYLQLLSSIEMME